MIDTTIKIIDRFIQLANYKERKSKEFFKAYIEPLYNDSQLITSDYLTLFQKLIHKIEDGATDEELIRWLEQRRIEHLPLRIKAKSMLSGSYERYPRKQNEYDEMDKFIEGIWQLIEGGLSLVEPGHISGQGGHTLLDILYRVINGNVYESEKVKRKHYSESAKYQMEYIQKACKQINDSYVEIKEKLV